MSEHQPDTEGLGMPTPDRDAIDRGIEALGRFVFPGHLVPRWEMAVAVVRAAMGDPDTFRDYLPPKRIVRADADSRAQLDSESREETP